MAHTEGRVARPERRWGCHRGIPQNTAKQNHPGSVTSYDTRQGNEIGLYYSASEPTWGESNSNSEFMRCPLQVDEDDQYEDALSRKSKLAAVNRYN